MTDEPTIHDELSGEDFVARTKSGRILTNADLETLAEAEHALFDDAMHKDVLRLAAMLDSIRTYCEYPAVRERLRQDPRVHSLIEDTRKFLGDLRSFIDTAREIRGLDETPPASLP
jgi:siroheme synthase